ncbi:MAG: DNA-processing protein DprA [Pseudomonadota bacterium]|nr:DNA-processing protein DprA [Pseudomonadota bacterium]
MQARIDFAGPEDGARPGGRGTRGQGDGRLPEQAFAPVAREAPRRLPAEADPLSALRLARSRNVGPSTWLRLVRRFGDPARALEALPDLARRGGLGAMTPHDEADAARELEAGARAGARLVILGGPGYPPALAAIPDPPPVFWLRGDAEAPSRPSVAIVGARNASAMGLRMARMLAAELGAAGFAVASGLARGVDGAAHEGALPTGTVAALAGCVASVYPREHAGLADRIAAEGGALISEAPMGTDPQARHFPRRNRVIAGLSRAVVLIEAAARSGSLITADFALEQGREVMAVPGSPLDPRSAGGNQLIRQGAALVRDAADVVESLEQAGDAPAALRGGEAAEPPLSEDGFAEPAAPPLRDDRRLRAEIAGLLGLAPVEEDELLRLSGASLAAVAEVLLEFELAGRLDRQPGGMLALLPEDREPV